MSTSALFTILHISDFHFAKRKHREQGIVVNALIKDLETLCVGHRRPDLVMFTGDLVQAAGVDSHDDAYDFLLDRVSKATGCSDERMFIAAGNHEVEWAGLLKHAAEHQEWRAILDAPDEMAQLNDLHEKGAFDQAVAAKFANYFDLEKYLSGEDRRGTRKLTNSFVSVDHVDALNVDLAIFNTAVLSTGGHAAFAKDERKLAVPEYAVMEAVGTLTPGSLRIFVTHSLSDAERTECSLS